MTELDILRAAHTKALLALSAIAAIATNNRGFHGHGNDLAAWEADEIVHLATEGAKGTQ